MPPIAQKFYGGSIDPPLNWLKNSLDPVDRAIAAAQLAPQPIFRAYEAKIDEVSKTERSIVAKINTGDVDRYKTVISPDGIDLTAYRKNPCVLWEHGKDPQRGSLPIGRNKWIRPSNGGNGMLVAKTLFGKDAYSQALFEMYEDGTLRGWSVNILPDHKRCSPPTKEEMRARPELAECTMMYRFGELAEYSGVAVPGNAETLSLLAERGIWCPRAAESQGLAAGGAAIQPGTPDPGALPRKKKKRRKEPSTQAQDLAVTDPGRTASDVRLHEGHNSLTSPNIFGTSRYIKHEGSQWIVYSESGKVLGKHESEADAKKQLAAIESSKHSGRTIVQDNGVYQVVLGSQVILNTPSRSVAEATLEAIDAPVRSWTDEYIRLLNCQQAWQTEMKRNAAALLDMIRTGRV